MNWTPFWRFFSPVSSKNFTSKKKWLNKAKKVEFPDLLGAAYEHLIKHFADSAGKKGGEFYTPSEVVRLLVQITRPQAGMTVYDPTVGSGGFLIQAHHYIRVYAQ